MSVVLSARTLRVGAAAIGLAFVLAIVLGVTGVLTPKAQRTAAGASTTLTIISGTVAIRSAGRDFGAADDGAILLVGDTVRTGADGRAVLTYFEGTTVEIEPSSELTIDAANARSDGSTVILMTQNIGRTWHVVTHLLSGNSKYEVRTPASTASVRGTQFEVAVTDEATTVTTSEGAVATSDPANTAEVLVTPGLTTTTRRTERPTPPVPAPTPERRVTVTVADPNTLIVDPLGRANGFKDGKLVVQTPGASVRIVDGKLVVTLLNMPDGTLAAHAGKKDAAGTDVETTVEERGKEPVTVTGRSASDGRGPAAVEVHRSTGSAPKVAPSTGEVQAPKVGKEIPATPEPAEAPRTDADAPRQSDAPRQGDAPRQSDAPRQGDAPRQVEPGRVPEVRTPEPARVAEPARTPDARPAQPGNSGFRPNIQLPAAPGSLPPASAPPVVAPPVHSPPRSGAGPVNAPPPVNVPPVNAPAAPGGGSSLPQSPSSPERGPGQRPGR